MSVMNEDKDKATMFLYRAILNHTVDYAGFVPLDSEGNVTKCAPHEAYKLIAVGKLTFDERIVLHRVGITMSLHRAILKFSHKKKELMPTKMEPREFKTNGLRRILA